MNVLHQITCDLSHAPRLAAADGGRRTANRETLVRQDATAWGSVVPPDQDTPSSWATPAGPVLIDMESGAEVAPDPDCGQLGHCYDLGHVQDTLAADEITAAREEASFEAMMPGGGH